MHHIPSGCGENRVTSLSSLHMDFQCTADSVSFGPIFPRNAHSLRWSQALA
jgi:hypothetical protein